MEKCRQCLGSGVLAGGSTPEPCDGCGGTGVAKAASQLCSTCQGRGSLLPPPPT